MSVKLRHVWLEYPQFDAFSVQLLRGKFAELKNMSQGSVLNIRSLGDGGCLLTINPENGPINQMSHCMNVTLKLSGSFIQGLADAFREFPKWW